MAVNDDKELVETARLEYIKGKGAPNDVARMFGLNERAFRKYLMRRGDIKPQHRNKSALNVERALQVIKEVQQTEVILPKNTQKLVNDFLGKVEQYKGKGLDFAMNALDVLNSALNLIDRNNLDEVVKIERLANAAKILSDMLGAYPKAPTIAIQNNLQQNVNQQQSKGNKIEVEVVEVK